MNTFFLIFIGLVILEIFFTIKIGDEIGALNTTFLIFPTAMVYITLGIQGIQTLRSGILNYIKTKHLLTS